MSDLWWGTADDLDPDQKKAVKLSLTESHLITGPPGSGKTNLLLLRAKHLLLNQERNFHILAFTRSLRDFIASGAPRYSVSGSHVTTSLSLIYDACRTLGIDLPAGDMKLRDKRRQLALSIKRHLQEYKRGPLYEHLLIDEIQDYTKDEIEALIAISRHIFAVGDDNQRIHTSTKESGMTAIRKHARETHLKHHYRNGHEICDMADRLARRWDLPYTLRDTSKYNEELHPSSVRLFDEMPLERQVKTALEQIDAQALVYSTDDMAILAPRRVTVERISDILISLGRRGEFELLGEETSVVGRPSARRWLGTAQSAKGCEFRCVHVIGAEDFKGENIRTLAYTTATRARTILSWYASRPLPPWLQSALMDDPSKAKDVSIDELFR